jgi:hypothetical protein
MGKGTFPDVGLIVTYWKVRKIGDEMPNASELAQSFGSEGTVPQFEFQIGDH